MEENDYIEINLLENQEITNQRNEQINKNMENYHNITEKLKETLLNIWELSKELTEKQELYEELTNEIYNINEQLITITTFNKYLLTPYKTQEELVSLEHL